MAWYQSSFCDSGACVQVNFKESSYCDTGTCISVGFQKSSYSDGNGECVQVGFHKSSYCDNGACIEVGFHKSTHSDSYGNCVEVQCQCHEDKVLVRDSKQVQLVGEDGGWDVLSFSRSDWSQFLRDLPVHSRV